MTPLVLRKGKTITYLYDTFNRRTAKISTVWSGIPKDTVSSQLLQQTGMSPRTAGFVDNSIGIVGNIGGAAILSTSRTATYSLPTKTVGQITKNEIGLVGNEGILKEAGKAKQLAQKYVSKNGTLTLEDLSKAGQIMDRGGLTKAGRALDKHGGRPGSVFKKPTGNPTDKNIQGQFHLNDILTHPQRTIIRDFEKGGIEIYAPDGRGVYIKDNGTFRGFIEWKNE